MKKIVSILVSITIIAGSIFAYYYFNKDESYVFASEYRNGYALQPTLVDASGVHVDSGFVFKWEEGADPVTVEELESKLTVSPEAAFSVEDHEDGLLIQMGSVLEWGTIYIFNFDGTTYAYKTEAEFALIGTFPRNQSTNVPLNTGIELVFNYEGVDLEDYFHIEPEVKGSFENHGGVVVFVSKGLEPATVYTITVDAGLPLPDSDKRIEETFSFAFETTMEGEYEQPGAYVNFHSVISEYSTKDVPEIYWDFYSYNGELKEDAQVRVYAYEDPHPFIQDINEFLDAPYWSWYGFEDRLTDVSDLERVMSFDYEMIETRTYPRSLTLPDKLEPGFYIVDVTWDEARAQTFIQVTDLGFFFAQTTNGELIWTHDLQTGQPLSGVQVYEIDLGQDMISGKKFNDTTNEQGIIDLLGNRGQEPETAVYLLEKDGQQSVCFAMHIPWYYGTESSQFYWKYFKTDRTLYKPDDQVEFFGYLKHRYNDETLDKVTVEISQGSFYYWDFIPYDQDTLSYVVVDSEVDHGFFSGKMTLPGLAQGGYQVQVKVGNDVAATTYISVEEYIKPSYKIEIMKDKEAIFVDDAVNMSVHSNFYEGTPVSYLDFEYNIGGIDYISGQETTDSEGVYSVQFQPKYDSDYQGEQHYYMSAYADLPETGSIWAQDTIRVFFNDVHLEAKAELDDEQGAMTFDMHTITLDRINSQTAENSWDYLDEPVENKTIAATVYRNEWIKTEVGEYYDFINKEVRKQYDYHLEKTVYERLTAVTDAQGHATAAVSLPEEDNVHYTAEVKTYDNKQRAMNYTLYFSEFGRYEYVREPYYHMELNQETYGFNDQVEASLKYGEEPLEGQFLFLVSQNGIVQYRGTDKPEITFNYVESYAPNVQVSGIYFNGKTYINAGSATARYDYEEKRIDLNIETDKDSYKPGETITVSLTATLENEYGDQVPAVGTTVNVGLIDEALLTLSEQWINPLEELYQWVPAGIFQTYSSHYNQNSYIFGRGMGLEEAEMATADSAAVDGKGMGGGLMEETTAQSGRDGAEIRSEFKDTAFYMTVPLSNDGKAEITMTLPDNITGWRLTGAAVSEALHAGSEVEQVNVTLPFFVNTSISEVYLTGDEPYVGLTVYGTGLGSGETVDYQVTVYNEDDRVVSSHQLSGQAFERVNAPLGVLTEEGNYRVVVEAYHEGGMSDGIETDIHVYETYHEKMVYEIEDAVVGMNLQGGDSGETTITFIDRGRGYYLPTLYSLAYAGGKRVDQQYLAEQVRSYLNRTFDTEYELEGISLQDYMVQSGGVAILPYAEADVETTVNMLPIIRKEVSMVNVSLYLKNAWYDKAVQNKGAVLYGMIQLGEPMLGELNSYAKTVNLNTKELLYLSMAYSEIGDTYMGRVLLRKAMDENLEAYEETAYIVGKTEDETYELTAAAMLAAQMADNTIHDKFYDYVTHHYSKEVLVNTFMYQYVIGQMGAENDVTGKVTYTYNGETREVILDDGYARSIAVPSRTLKNFDITQVEGDVQIALQYMVNQKVEGNDQGLMVERTYYNYRTGKETNTFVEGDLVKVVLNWKVEDIAADEFYRLTDYAPSGLKPIDNPWQLGLRHEGRYMWYRDVDGQKVDFYIYKDKEKDQYEPLVYYARIASIGTYQAEGPMIQGTRIKDSLWIGTTDTLAIVDK